MNIVLDTSRLDYFFAADFGEMMWLFFANVGWIVLAIFFLFGVREIYLFYIQTKFAKGLKYVLLAIDVPRGNAQSPKAVENLFTFLGGAHGSVSFYEKWFEGRFQQAFSFEIIGIDGYTQFAIRTPVEQRFLLESAIYSQYPDAEISEIDDYTPNVPNRFPDDEWDLWGGEFILSAPDAYPIKLYSEFESMQGEPEERFKDPMATLMDLTSSLNKGEQLWLQFIVIPTDFAWVKRSDAEVDKILGKTPKTKQNLFMSFLVWLGDLSEQVFAIWKDIKPKEEKKALSMMELTPKKIKQIEGIQNKASKLGFGFKMRAICIGRKGVFNKGKMVSGLVGWVKQFTALDLNGFKPDMKVTATKTAYFRKDARLVTKKNIIMQNYVNRSLAGRPPSILNIEELATLWHFPLDAVVKAPLIQKAPGRKSDAPAALPLADDISNTQAPPPDIFSGLTRKEEKPAPEKTVTEDSSPVVEDDRFWLEPSGPVKNNFYQPAPKTAAEKLSDTAEPPADLPFV